MFTKLITVVVGSAIGSMIAVVAWNRHKDHIMDFVDKQSKKINDMVNKKKEKTDDG